MASDLYVWDGREIPADAPRKPISLNGRDFTVFEFRQLITPLENERMGQMAHRVASVLGIGCTTSGDA